MPTLPNPWILLGLVLAWVASLVAVGAWQRHDGAEAVKNDWLVQKNGELISANAEILRLTGEAAKKEELHARDLAELSTAYEKERKNVEDRAKRDRRAAADGSIVFNDAGGVTANRGTPSEAATGAGERHDAKGCRLSTEATGFLLDLANEADATTEQLSACQGVIREDRALFGVGDSP